MLIVILRLLIIYLLIGTLFATYVNWSLERIEIKYEYDVKGKNILYVLMVAILLWPIAIIESIKAAKTINEKSMTIDEVDDEVIEKLKNFNEKY